MDKWGCGLYCKAVAPPDRLQLFTQKGLPLLSYGGGNTRHSPGRGGSRFWDDVCSLNGFLFLGLQVRKGTCLRNTASGLAKRMRLAVALDRAD